MIRNWSVWLTTRALCAVLLLTATPVPGGTFKPAPQNGIPEVYIVVLAKGVASTPRAPRPDLPTVAQIAQSLGRAHGGRVEEVWEHALQAFVIRMPEARARKLAEDPRVVAVEQDFSFSSFSAPVGDCYLGTPVANTRALPSSSPQTLTCSDPDPVNDTDPAKPPRCVDNWGLDRIDQSRFDGQYFFTNNGSTVHVYVLDTGIRSTHREFLDANGATRVTGGADARQSPAVAGTPANTADCIGHGTHVAGIIGGRTYGVAKNAILHPVRIAGCVVGQNEPIRFARGLDWIVANVQRPAVINWSGGNGPSRDSITLREAVQGVLDNNIILVQAAGNQSPDYDPANPALLRDACEFSFGGQVPSVIVAAGMDEYDGRWTRKPGAVDPDDGAYCGSDCGSNAGSCVDIWAPSAHVNSSSMAGDDLTCRLSGTSMAAPHVTGVVAVYLQSNPNATPAEVEQALRSRGRWGVLESYAGSANYIGDDSDNVVVYSDTRSMGSDLPPVASFSYTCQGLACTFDATGSSDDFGINSYDWRFGDGTIGSGSLVQHVFPANFNGRVTLRVTDGLNHTDHVSQTVSMPPSAPTNVLATASGGTVSITWTQATGADGYDVERRVAGGDWTVAQTVTDGTQSSASDTPVSASGVVLYRVVARAGTNRSEPSNNDVAYVGTFTDDPVLATAPYTTVKAAHIIQLRRAVNGLREVIGLAPVYGGAELDEAALRGQIVDDAHFTTLLSDLNAARSLAGLPPKVFSDPPAQGQLIRRTQIEDLRNGVK